MITGNFQPGDGTSYRWLFELTDHWPDSSGYRGVRNVFGFGVGDRALIVFGFNGAPDFEYYVEKMAIGSMGKNPVTLWTGFRVLCALTGLPDPDPFIYIAQFGHNPGYVWKETWRQQIMEAASASVD